MAGPERAATVAALISLIRSTSESPAGDRGAFSLMLGGSDILCRKGVGSISPAPLGRLLHEA